MNEPSQNRNSSKSRNRNRGNRSDTVAVNLGGLPVPGDEEVVPELDGSSRHDRERHEGQQPLELAARRHDRDSQVGRHLRRLQGRRARGPVQAVPDQQGLQHHGAVFVQVVDLIRPFLQPALTSHRTAVSPTRETATLFVELW